MVNALVAEARLPAGRIRWEDWVRQFAAGMRVLAREHPGAFETFHYGPAQGERAAEPFESAIAAFRSAGFDAASTRVSLTDCLAARWRRAGFAG